MRTITAVGSLEALAEVLRRDEPIPLTREADVVVVPTAAAFTGAEEASIGLASLFESYGARVEALMNIDRVSSDEPYFATRLRGADIVVLGDGSVLHARSVWRESLVGAAIRDARAVVAVGSVASVLGQVMIDPRGGAPTNGLGLFEGVVLGVGASDEQLARTRSLLGDERTFVVLGQGGAVHFDGTTWRQLVGDVVVTRGANPVEL